MTAGLPAMSRPDVTLRRRGECGLAGIEPATSPLLTAFGASALLNAAIAADASRRSRVARINASPGDRLAPRTRPLNRPQRRRVRPRILGRLSADIESNRPTSDVGGHQDLPAGGPQTLPTHNYLVTQHAGSGLHDGFAGAVLDRHFGDVFRVGAGLRGTPVRGCSRRLVGTCLCRSAVVRVRRSHPMALTRPPVRTARAVARRLSGSR